MPTDGTSSRLVNFGGNQAWSSRLYQPRSEQQVLDILARHGGDTIRALGSLHSWSGVAAGADISLDLSALDQVEPYTENGESFVRVGAGCKLQDLLDRVHATTDRTMPTLGAIKKQAIAGAASTATHGSGRPSLSHFVSKVRIAAYDPVNRHSENLRIHRRRRAQSRPLRARLHGDCSVARLATVPKYQVTEIVRPYHDVADILAAYNEWPLTQFILMPHSWGALAYHRKRAEGTASGSRFSQAPFLPPL